MHSTATKVMARHRTSRGFRPTGPAQSIADLLRQSLRRVSNFINLRLPKGSGQAAKHLAAGRQGEKMAAEHLRRNGYKVLFKNFKPKRGGEIDLVCRDRRENTLVFIEVKTRSTDAFGAPHFAVTQKKRERIMRGAKEWLRMLDDPKVSYRFDIVEVVLDYPCRITLLRSAFEMRDDIYY
jgi:putative endonuclease